MKITIRPDPDCIDLIRSKFKDTIIVFLKSVGSSAKDALNWESTHTIEINEKMPPMVKIFEMDCFLPEVLFKKSEWVFKIAKNNLFDLFIIADEVVCCNLLNTDGLIKLPENILNLCAEICDVETLNDNFQELKKLCSLRNLNLIKFKLLKDLSVLSDLIQLRYLNLSECESISDLSPLASLNNLKGLCLGGGHLVLGRDNKLLKDLTPLSNLTHLQSLDLNWCTSLSDISPIVTLTQLQSLNLEGCESLSDISPLSNLTQLQSLDLCYCESLTDISPLFTLPQLQSLNLIGCASLTDINPLSGLPRLQALNLQDCRSLSDISPLSTLTQLQSLNLQDCRSLSDISPLSNLTQLQSLKLFDCRSLSDISPLSTLTQLQHLEHGSCKSLSDIKPLSNLIHLQSLNLPFCYSLRDISPLSSLTQLQSLGLNWCKSLSDISPLSSLTQLRDLDISECESLSDISGLSNLVNLQSLSLIECKRIQNFSPLRKCLALKELKESKMHPAESAELLCFLAVKRKDISFIYQKTFWWLQELELALGQNLPSTNDLACSLAQGIILANLDEVGLSFHQTLLNHPNVRISPWKIWFSENLKTYGWDKIQKLAELNQLIELTFGAIGGISSCLPSLEGDSAQIAWARKWIFEIHSLHNTNPKFLKPAAAEWCLALKRLGEDELLREWIEKFTDPSDPSALDPINKVFSVYALDLNDCESALEYALKINDPKLRDESILNLAQQFIKEGETTKAGEFLFLLTQIESRTQLAYTLAEDTAYLKSNENAHRLLAACGDSPQSLASILDKLRLANPDSEILEIMNEKLSDVSRLLIPASLILQESNSYTNTLLKIKDSIQLEKIRQAIESVMKSS